MPSRAVSTRPSFFRTPPFPSPLRLSTFFLRLACGEYESAHDCPINAARGPPRLRAASGESPRCKEVVSVPDCLPPVNDQKHEASCEKGPLHQKSTLRMRV